MLLGGDAQARAIHTIYAVKAGSIVGLTLDESGTIYGADGWGGGHNAGAIFEIAPDGSAKTLHNFQKDSGPAQPQARPLIDASGTVYDVGERNGNEWGPIVFALNKRSVSTVTFFHEQYNSQTLALRRHDGRVGRSLRPRPARRARTAPATSSRSRPTAR